ncbi:SEFIR domain-containing protein [Meloidogyne graminicola]|uniref:SEFIR domain-containing protein n=1 Tax=Meloidogyne graminicola TaxID=189291 RepID=A0A8T0A3M6_9BILA|nr:SEFIR domain-containing protein [Meloidogyne graminicola]
MFIFISLYSTYYVLQINAFVKKKLTLTAFSMTKLFFFNKRTINPLGFYFCQERTLQRENYIEFPKQIFYKLKKVCLVNKRKRNCKKIGIVKKHNYNCTSFILILLQLNLFILSSYSQQQQLIRHSFREKCVDEHDNDLFSCIVSTVDCSINVEKLFPPPINNYFPSAAHDLRIESFTKAIPQ